MKLKQKKNLNLKPETKTKTKTKTISKSKFLLKIYLEFHYLNEITPIAILQNT